MKQQDWPYCGARWWKFDFHTHTPASNDWDKANSGGQPPSPEEWLLAYMQAGIDCVAVTDHNSGEWIDKLKTAYDLLQDARPPGFRPLYIFPGVEMSVNGGIHLLAVFGGQMTTSDVAALLGVVGWDGTRGDSDGVTRKAIVEVIAAAVEAGGVVIPAHVDDAKGLLRLEQPGKAKSAVDSQTLKQVLECGKIDAIETLDRNRTKPQIYVDSKCGWTEVLGSDSHGFRGANKPGSRFTWVKMSEPSIDGLRLALLDGERFSIRRSDDGEPFDPLVPPKHIVESVEIREARYMGRGKPARLCFSPWFNALVGGRGTGKSTVVHALRLAYQRGGDLQRLETESEARRTFERFVRAPQSRIDYGALDYRKDQRTEIAVCVKREDAQYRLTWRQSSGGTAVEYDAGGDWSNSPSQAVTADRFPIRIFSQGQIAALAGENPGALLGLIDEAAGLEPAHNRVEQAKKSYLASRAKMRELDGTLHDRGRLQLRLEELQRKLATFEGKDHAAVLKTYQLRSRQNREVDRQLERTKQLADSLVAEASRIAADNLTPGLFESSDGTDREAVVLVERLHAGIEAAEASVRTAGETLRMVVANERAELANNAWFTSVREASASYSQLTQELKQEGVADPSEFGRLVQDRQETEAELARLIEIEAECERLRGESRRQRDSVRAARREVTKGRKDFLAAKLAQNPYVRIEVVLYGRNERMVEQQFREAIGVMDNRFSEDILVQGEGAAPKGLVAELIRGLNDDEAAGSEIERRLDEMTKRVANACRGQAEFGGHFNNFLQREASQHPEFFDALQVWAPEDELRVEYSPKGDGRDFRPIAQASAGQRAAAMLALLLAYGDEPLVLDQPEDDLDNHLVYELVVNQIRETKLRRQIIVVTHNPNIVVNGDAEMLHALDFRGGQCVVVKAGSLQEPEIREEVCRVMEGGREAFERRYRRLGGGETGNV
jgi:hypothetical protein